MQGNDIWTLSKTIWTLSKTIWNNQWEKRSNGNQNKAYMEKDMANKASTRNQENNPNTKIKTSKQKRDVDKRRQNTQ